MRFRVLVSMATLVAMACGGSSDAPTAPSASSGTSPGVSTALTATIDGVAFLPTKVTASYFEGASASPSANLEVDAVDASLNLLSFAISRGPNQLLTLGAYQLGGPLSAASVSTAAYVLPGGTSTWLATSGTGSGTITLATFSKTTKTASGTFSLVLKNSTSSKTVTNGTFNVTFP